MVSHTSAVFLAASLVLATSIACAEPNLSAPEALTAASEGKVRLIDIRTPQEWRETGVAPGAGRVDFYLGPEVLLSAVLQMVGGDKDAPIALICRTGNRTTHAQVFL
jgi:rhodanese-related sulfurtransferase